MGFLSDIIGNVLDVGANIWGHEKEEDWQSKVLHNSIKWRVEDAKRAGIHPLYAIGAPSMSVSTSAFNTGGAFSEMGQNLARSRMANADRAERMAAAHEAVTAADSEAQRLQLDNMRLQNQMLASQIAHFNSAQVGPPFPSMGSTPGLGGSDRVQPVPAMPTINSPYHAGREAGNVTDFAYSRTADGGLVITPSQDVKNRIEDSPLEWAWALRNGIISNFSNSGTPSTREFPLPRGFEWKWDWDRQAYYPFNRSTGEWINSGRRRLQFGRDRGPTFGWRN